MKRISLLLAMALLLAVVPMGARAEAIAPDGLDLAQDLEAADEAIELPGLELDVPDPVSEAIPAPQDETTENAGDVAINRANFPDKVFRAYVKERFDTDGNGKLSQAEINAVEVIPAAVNRQHSHSLPGRIVRFLVEPFLCCRHQRFDRFRLNPLSAL